MGSNVGAMGGAASTKVKCQSILPSPQEGSPRPLRPTLRDHYLDNFDYKTMAEPDQPAQIKKKDRCEIHPFSLPELEDSDDELEVDCLGASDIRTDASSVGSQKGSFEVIQKRKRCSVVPVEILGLMDCDSDDEIDRILTELESKLEHPRKAGARCEDMFLESF